MVGIESSAYTMNENEEMEVKLIRYGGADNTLQVTVSPNPGSAIQDDFDTELISHVTFAPGEKEKTALVRTRRNTNTTGNRQFSIELTSEDDSAILGWNDRAVITINDSEAMNADKLLELVAEAESLDSNIVTGDWQALKSAIASAKAQAAAGGSAEVMQKAYDELQAVMDTFQDRDLFSAEDHFVFPGPNSSTTLEAEYSTLHDVNLPSDGQWSLRVSEADWASRGKFVNCLNQQDTITIPYSAKHSGTYSVTVYYRSGDPKNNLVWSEPSGKIASGSVEAGAGDSAQATHSVQFTIQITEPGDGQWIFTGPNDKSPQIDRFEITPLELDVNTYQVTLQAGEGGTITGPESVVEGESADYTITPDAGYSIADVRVNGESRGAVSSLHLDSVEADTTIEADFAFQYWSASNPFIFPEVSGTLEAEEMEMHNTGTNEDWPLQISTGSWCGNGKFLNAMNTNDSVTLYYNAPSAGTYHVTLTFRSGDSKNGFTWAEKDGKIASGSIQAGADDSARNTHTASFDWVVLEPGEGELTLTAFEKNAPQMDRFDLIKAVDTQALSNLITQAEAKLAGGTYTEESAAALRTAIENARSVLANASATQAEVDAAAEAVQNAMDALVEVIPSADKSILNALITQAEALDLNLYKDGEAKDEFNAALKEATAISEDETASQEAVDASAARLNAAITALELKEEPEDVNITILQIVVEEADALDLEKYVPAGQDAFLTARENAHSVLAAPADQKSVDQAAAGLNAALLNLRLKADESLIASLKDFVRTVSLMNLDAQPVSVQKMARAQVARVQAALDAHEEGTAVLSMTEARELKEENDKVLSALRPEEDKPAEPVVRPEEPAKPEEDRKPVDSTPENKDVEQKTEPKTESKTEAVKEAQTESKASATTAKSVKTAAGGMGLWLAAAGASLAGLFKGRKKNK